MDLHILPVDAAQSHDANHSHIQLSQIRTRTGKHVIFCWSHLWVKPQYLFQINNPEACSIVWQTVTNSDYVRISRELTPGRGRVLSGAALVSYILTRRPAHGITQTSRAPKTTRKVLWLARWRTKRSTAQKQNPRTNAQWHIAGQNLKNWSS